MEASSDSVFSVCFLKKNSWIQASIWTSVTATEAKEAPEGRIRYQPEDPGQWRRKRRMMKRRKLVRKGRSGASIMNPQANGLWDQSVFRSRRRNSDYVLKMRNGG